MSKSLPDIKVTLKYLADAIGVTNQAIESLEETYNKVESEEAKRYFRMARTHIKIGYDYLIDGVTKGNSANGNV